MTERGIGDNLPTDLAERAKLEISDALVAPRDRVKVLRVSADALAARGPITDLDYAQRATDLGSMYSAVIADIEAAHERIKQPYLSAGRVVDVFRARALTDANEGGDIVTAALAVWHKAESDRIKAKREATQAAFAADPEPSVMTMTMPPRRRTTTVHGDLGGRSGLRADLEITIDDVKKIPKRILQRDGVIAAIKAAVRPLIKAGETVPGVSSRTVDKLSVTKG